jgi:multimeric flavodoxin WrbA
MNAIILNGTLKPSPDSSSTEALAGVVARALRDRGVTQVEQVRLVDHDVKPGVETDMGGGDAWPQIHDRILGADILIVATPTWLGQISSVTKRALERMDAMLSETDGDGVPVAYNKVAGAVVVGNEDGAHACIASIAKALHANPIAKPPNA